MATIIKGINWWIDENADSRAKSYWLMSTPWPVLAILTIYLCFIRQWGPQIMKNRQPFKLDRFIMAYNLAQILLCGYLFQQIWVLGLGWGKKAKWICEPIRYTNEEEPLRILTAAWLYFISRMFDLLDTIFFVLRKKFNQITFLHVYHHILMAGGSWYVTRFAAGGHVGLLAGINCFVHMVMYGYYFITILWPQNKEKIWWKKYITQLQMIQFLIAGFHNLLCVLEKDCEYPQKICVFVCLQNVIMFVLFFRFYVNAYIKKKKLN